MKILLFFLSLAFVLASSAFALSQASLAPQAQQKPSAVSGQEPFSLIQFKFAPQAEGKASAVSDSKNALPARRKPARFEGHNIKTLRLKDYEEMRDLLYVYIRDSRSVLPEDGMGGGDIAVMELKNGLKALFMRPNTDALLRSLIPIIQNEIIKYRNFMSVLRELARQSAQELKAGKGSVSYQAGLLYLLENSLAYTQSINNPNSQALLKEIKSADIKISRKLSSWLTLEMGRGRVKSPSRLAGDILRARQRAGRKSRKQKTQAGAMKAKKRHPAGKTAPSEDSSQKTIHLR